jgi:hypothetical protein
VNRDFYIRRAVVGREYHGNERVAGMKAIINIGVGLLRRLKADEMRHHSKNGVVNRVID